MNLFKRLFSTSKGDCRETSTPPVPAIKSSASQASEKEVKENLARSINERQAGLPVRALIALGARMQRGLLPVFEKSAAGSWELNSYKSSLADSEFEAGLVDSSPPKEALSAPMSNLRVWYSATFMLVSTHMMQACLARKTGAGTDDPATRAKVSEFVGLSILHAIELSCSIYGGSEEMIAAIMRAIANDTDLLRKLVAEKGLDDKSPVSTEWLGDIWIGTQNPYKDAIKGSIR